MQKAYKLKRKREGIMRVVFLLSALFSIFALLTICLFLLANGLPFIAKIGIFEFIFGGEWSPVADQPSYGIFPMILGSLYVTALATAIGVTLGLFMAIFLYKFCDKKLAACIRQLVNLLAGIPSVILGLFGLLIVVPFLREVSPSGVGHGILAASLILAIMILPTVVSISLESLKAVPNEIFEGALALGATNEQAVFRAVLPAARSGVLASVVLSIGRAIGETMAVIMVIGGSTQVPTSLFQSVRTMTANIAMGALEMTGDAFTALIATGVVLFAFTLILNVCFAAFKYRKSGEKQPKKRVRTCSNSKMLSFVMGIRLMLREIKMRLSPDKRFYKFLKWASIFCALTATLALVGIVMFVFFSGMSFVDFNFIFGEYDSLQPTIFPAIVGTMFLIFIALLLATPLGILTAIFLTEYAKKGRLVRVIRVAAETLAAIPSIVYGLFGYLVFVVTFRLGYSLLGGGITLSLMILPTIIRSTEESLLAVPAAYREGSHALGSGKLRTVFSVVLPSATPGILSAIILSTGRVISESAVLILTIGMVVNNLPSNALMPGTSLALNVYYFGSHGQPEAAAATAVVLLFLVVAINLLATVISKLLTRGKT